MSEQNLVDLVWPPLCSGRGEEYRAAKAKHTGHQTRKNL